MSGAARQVPRTTQGIRIKPEQRFFLCNVSWEDYELISDGLGERWIRATYDRGQLELMMPSHEHELIKWTWGQLVAVMAEEMRIPVKGAGSATQRRKDLSRAIEADDCFYIKSWPRIRGKRKPDLAADPPPDLALEVDVTSLSLKRLPIYAALRVPEVWRFDGATIHVLLLNASGDYEESDHSPTFPGVPIAGLVTFLMMWSTDDDTTIRHAFRTWLRQQLARRKKQPRRPRRDS